MADPWFLLMVVFALALGSLAKGITGIGLPLIAIPLLSAFVGVEHAVVIMALPSFVSNGWLIYVHHRHAPPAKVLAPFLIPGFLGCLGGTWLLAIADDRTLTQLLAVWLGLYLLQLQFRPHFRLPGNWSVAPLFGTISGAIQGATGISAPVIAPWLTGIGLTREAFVFSISLSFSFFTVAQMLAMGATDLWTTRRLIEGLVALLPVMLFLHAGVRWARSIPPDGFRKVLLLTFVLMEARLIYSGFWAQA